MVQTNSKQAMEPAGGKGGGVSTVLLCAVTVYVILAQLVNQMIPAVAQGVAQQVSMLCDAVLMALMVWRFPRARVTELRALVLNVCWLFLTRVVMGSLFWQSTGSFYVGVLMLSALAVPMILGQRAREIVLDIVTAVVCALTSLWGLLGIVTFLRGGAGGFTILGSEISLSAEGILNYFGYESGVSASFFAVGLGLMLTQLCRRRHLLWRIWAALYVPVSVAALVLVRSTSGMLAAAICLGAGVGVAIHSLMKNAKPGLRRVLSILAAVLFAVLCSLGLMMGTRQLTQPAQPETAAPAAVETAEPAAAETEAPAEPENAAEATEAAPAAELEETTEVTEDAAPEETAETAETEDAAPAETAETESEAETEATSAPTPAHEAAAPAQDSAAPAEGTVSALNLNGFLTALRARPLTLLIGQDEGLTEEPGYVDNLLLHQLLTAGIPGMVIYLIFLCCLLYRMVKTWLSEEVPAALKCLSGLLLGLLAYGMLEPMLSSRLLFASFLFCLLSGYLVQGCEACGITAPKRPAPKAQRKKSYNPQRLTGLEEYPEEPVDEAYEEELPEEEPEPEQPQPPQQEERAVVHVPRWMLEKTPVLAPDDLALVVNREDPDLYDEEPEEPEEAPAPEEPAPAQRKRGGHHRTKRASGTMRVRPNQSRDSKRKGKR